MIKFIQFTTILIVLVAMIACGGEEAQQSSEAGETSDGHTEHQHSNASKQEPSSKEDAALTLNNGEKWKANQETTEGVQNMIAHMKEFRELKDPEQCKGLQSALQDEINYIISQCTMKGEAHEQLHQYLTALQSNIEGLASDDIGQCKVSYNKIKTLLIGYDKHFK